MKKEGASNVWDMLNQAEMARLGRSTPQPLPSKPGSLPPVPPAPPSAPSALPPTAPRTQGPPPLAPSASQPFPPAAPPASRPIPPLAPAASPPAPPEGATSEAALLSNQSSVLSASRFAQANSTHLDRMAAAARDWTETERGSSDPVLAHLDSTRPNDRFVPSPEALMDELVVSTELPRESVRRSVNSVRNQREAQAQRNSSFPGASDNGRRAELSRKLVMALGVLCFVLAGSLLYIYFFSSFGPHRTNDAALQMSQELDRDARLAQEVPEMGTIAPLSSVEKPPEVAGQVTENVPLPANVNPIKPGIKVHVAGAVNKPGLISLPFEARIDDAIKAAGGFSPRADKESVNLASYVSDGDQIVVASRGDEAEGTLNVAVDDQRTKRRAAPAKAKSTASGKSAATPGAKKAATGAAATATSAETAGESAAETTASSKKKAASSSNEVEFAKVDVNKANAIELLQLRGVGPQIAEAIVQYRDQLPQKRFTSVDQLQNVPGIGASKLQDMRAQVQL